MLSCKTLVWIGALSYSLYLWHWPVLAFLRYYTGAEVLSAGFSLLFILLTLVLSIISYYGVERVFRSKRTNKKHALGWVLLAGSVLGTSQAIAKVNAIFTPEQLPIEYRRYADPETICHGEIVGDCLQGDLDSDREILVLGDSHGAMLNHFFDYIGKELGFKARIITASSCVTIPGFDYERIPEWARQPCINQIDIAKEYMQQTEIIVLAGMWSYQALSQEFIFSLESLFDNNQHKFFILSQVPKLNREPDRVTRFQYLGLTAQQATDTGYDYANSIIEGVAQNFDYVDFIRLDELSVFNSIPFYGNELMYLDSHHLNEMGSLIYAQSARDVIGVYLAN